MQYGFPVATTSFSCARLPVLVVHSLFVLVAPASSAHAMTKAATAAAAAAASVPPSSPTASCSSASGSSSSLPTVSPTAPRVSYSYCDPVPEDLLCSVCSEPFISPRSCDKCGNTFCEQCLASWLERNSTCPHCRASISCGVPNRVVANQCNRLRVLCRLASNGCTWTGEREQFGTHIGQCQFLLVPSTKSGDERPNQRLPVIWWSLLSAVIIILLGFFVFEYFILHHQLEVMQLRQHELVEMVERITRESELLRRQTVADGHLRQQELEDLWRQLAKVEWLATVERVRPPEMEQPAERFILLEQAEEVPGLQALEEQVHQIEPAEALNLQEQLQERSHCAHSVETEETDQKLLEEMANSSSGVQTFLFMFFFFLFLLLLLALCLPHQPTRAQGRFRRPK